MDLFPAIDWSMAGLHLAQIAIAYLMAAPIGWDREASDRSAGLRTFPLVAVGSCSYMLIALAVFAEAEPRARVLYGIITGIGFIGGGAILKDGDRVHGTATAASIWNTGAIGVAVAWRRYEVGLVLAVVSLLTLRLLVPLKREKPDR